MSEKSIAIKGGLWMSLSTMTTMASQLLRIIVLTRFLSKSDFGIVSISSMIIGLCLAFADLGFSSIVMYKHDLKDEEFSSLYWIQLVLYLIIAGIMTLVSPLIGMFYEEPELQTVVTVSALTIVCLSIGQLYESVLQKNYYFKSIALRNIITNILSLFLVCYLAYVGFGVYSMILSTIFQTLLYNLWNITIGVRIRKLRFCCHFKKVYPLVKMGLFQTYTRIADYFSSQLDTMIIGKLLGLDALGCYDLAKQLLSRLGGFLRTVFSQVALPLLSNNNQNSEVVKARFLTIVKMVAYICTPICMTIAVFSFDIVRIIYGDSYVEIAPLVAIFSILTVITSIGSYFDMLGIAKGRMDLNFMMTIFRIVITTPIIFIASMICVEAVAWGQVLSSIILIIPLWKYFVEKTYPIPFMQYISQFSKLLIVSILLGITFYYVFNLTDIFSNLIIVGQVFVKLFIYIIIATAVGYAFLGKELRILYAFIRNK